MSTQPDRETSRRILAGVHPADRFALMFGGTLDLRAQARLKIAELLQQDGLAPETRKLLELALQAHDSGAMPDLSSLREDARAMTPATESDHGK